MTGSLRRKRISCTFVSRSKCHRVVSQDEAIHDSGSIDGDTNMDLFDVVTALLQQKPTLAGRQERHMGYTPMHSAFKAGNLELALWIMHLAPNAGELANIQDNDGMRPIDLLAFRVDDDHKGFLKDCHKNEKNYKIKKCYQAYSWGRAENFQLGYPTLKES